MEKKINPNLSFVRPEHYNPMLGLFFREQERNKEENTLYVALIFVIAFGVFYLYAVSLCPNGFSYIRPVIYLQ